ncbi:MAG TPA: DUF4126 domain-containing protein [Rubrobacter sp.]|nr:DUF4126 domain-containing protein [Rubrobacter sp.]
MLVAVGLGVGLACVAGVRAFLPLALAVLFTVFGLFEFPVPIVAVDEGVLIAILGALAVLEIVLDKIRTVERVFNIAMVPIRAVSGALLFNAALGLDIETGSPLWLVAGAVIAGAVAVLKLVLRPAAGTPSTGVSPSFLSAFEDVVAVVGGVIGLFVPYLPALLVAFLLFFFNRIRKRRGRKFGGLRILGD